MTSAAVSVVLSLLLSGGGSSEEQWAQFRGPGGAGVAPDSAPLPALLDPDVNLVWKTALEPGHSSPCIWGERIFLTAASGSELSTIALDRVTGEVLWRRAVEVPALERMHRINSAAASTATSDGERVFVHFGAFGLLCYDFEGEELWRRELALPQNTFGTAASPILAEGMLIFLRDTNGESYLEALDPESGETIWKRERAGFQSGWSTPVLLRRDEADELVVYGVWWVTAYDLADGSERWKVPGLTDEPIVTPVLGEGLVFLTSYNMKTNTEVIGLPAYAELLAEHDDDASGDLTLAEIEDNPSVLSRADADGEGDHPLRIFMRMIDEDRNGSITSQEYDTLLAWVDGFAQENALLAIRPGNAETPAEIAWKHERGVPECPSPLLYDGRVYMLKNGGMATCLDARTGKLHYEERTGARGPIYASPVAGDGKVYTATARGELCVLAAGDELEVLSLTDLGERIMATPALLEGKVYVRTEEHLYAFGAEPAPK